MTLQGSDDFVLLIDESGQAGIARIRTSNSGGATPYMSLGAVLVRRSDIPFLREQLLKIAGVVNRANLHCSEMRHHQKVFFARRVSTLPLLAFGLLSRKETLGGYGRRIAQDSNMYYNKCAQLLLEKVGKFLGYKGIHGSKVSVIFEEGNFNYRALRTFISKCRENPYHVETRYLANIEPMSISAKSKRDEPLLELADLFAHAIFKCADKSLGNFEIPEPRYLTELTSRFCGDPRSGRVEGYGLKLVHELRDVQLDSDVEALVAAMSSDVASSF